VVVLPDIEAFADDDDDKTRQDKSEGFVGVMLLCPIASVLVVIDSVDSFW
jgi:hypothetical protein